METLLSGMISQLSLPPPTEVAPPQMDTSGSAAGAGPGTPTPPNSSASNSTGLPARTPSANSPATTTNSSTPLAADNLAPQQQTASPSQSSGPGQQQQQQRTSRTFFRPPGLGPKDGDMEFPENVMVCPHCAFSCSSKFHYNSHMNTHTTHQCSMCNYQSRTEGRLKKHMQLSHTHEQRVAAGMAMSPAPASAVAAVQQQSQATSQSSPRPMAEENCLLGGMGDVPTSIAPLLSSMFSSAAAEHPGAAQSHLAALESFNSMLNNSNPMHQQFANPTDALLKICTDAISNNGPNEKSYSSPQTGDLGHTALDHLRALVAERHSANFLTTSTGNVLGFADMQQIGGGLDAASGGAEDGEQQQPKQEGSTPRRAGKPKQYKCKQCAQVSRSKKEQWAHARLHIPKQKQLSCEQCDFVTEYKHHLEYHYRNHNGQKPFKCSTCAYTCVNKSMLNSHMKSHTPVYQFRCQDCTYQTKYCHSLKMHLKKYNHKRAPGPNGSESSDSHGEERPENASSSSVGKEESFEQQQQPMGGGTNGAQLLLHNMNGTSSHVDEESGGLGSHQLELAHSLLMGGGPHQMQLGALPEAEMSAQQQFLLQQQLEQMNELIRNAVVNCPHCSFSTGEIDEMNRHLLFHLIATQQQLPAALSNEQQALASIYQRLTTQLQQELVPAVGDGPHPLPHHHQQQQLLPAGLNPSALLGQMLAGGSSNGGGGGGQQTAAGEMPMELEKVARQMERDAAENICHQQQQQQQGHHQPPGGQQFTPTTVAALLANAGGGGGPECGGATNSETGMDCSSSNGGAGTTNNKSEPGPCSSASAGLKKEFASFVFPLAGGGPVEQQQPIQQQSSKAHSLMPNAEPKNSALSQQHLISGGVNSLGGNGFDHGHSLFGQFHQIQSGHIGSLPFFCQQCEIAFKDAALYQVHRGFHARESPFKCNICGHLSCTALDFNLHLYQAKHE